MPVFDQLQKASFQGIVFPIESCESAGSIRDFHHIYPHARGASVELMGRNLYTFRMEANFQATFPKYPGLWPYRLQSLRKLWEEETIADLVVPTIGTIKAYCRNWSIRMEARIRSGEKVHLEFSEDQDATSLTESLISVKTQSLATATKNFDKFKALSDFQNDKKTESIFDAISNVANSFLALGDQSELAGNLISAKLQGILNLIDQADATFFSEDPMNSKMLSAMKDLWDITLSTLDSIDNRHSEPLQIFIVGSTTTISVISSAIYGTADKAIELMQLNPIEDVFAIPAGTQIKYHP